MKTFLNRLKSIRIGRGTVIGIPMLWMIIFLFLPFAIVFYISLTSLSEGTSPPYTDIFAWGSDGLLTIKINLANYTGLVLDNLYLISYASSVGYALMATFFCLLIGYPLAYAIARSNPAHRTIFLMLVIMPFWTSFLIRVYAWIGILKENGFINQILMGLGVINDPIPMLYTPFAVVVGMTYTYLPFMILPLYSNLEKFDLTLLEAAADLGAKPKTAWFRITLPLSMPGIIAGSLLVFIPACGEYVIPSLLGGPETLMIGRTLVDEFFANRDWPVASAVAIVLLAFLLIPIVWFQTLERKADKKGAK
ncbi:MAG: ABC transporter permease subunit [Candidatus Pacebacteria bacterium]|nr:ABC transporter permease subunit [Candidatus Paceibacterota bacterium]